MMNTILTHIKAWAIVAPATGFVLGTCRASAEETALLLSDRRENGVAFPNETAVQLQVALWADASGSILARVVNL
jgi:ABC-type phosphate transport system permease subunit